MKVKELIQILVTIDQEKEIRRYDEGFPEEIEEIQEISDYYYIH